MNIQELLIKLSDAVFARYLGISKVLFYELLGIVKDSQADTGRHTILLPEQQLALYLRYYKANLTYEDLGIEYGLIDKSTVGNIIKKIDKLLLKSKLYKEIEELTLSHIAEQEVGLLDVTEIPIERPVDNKKQKKVYSGKKNNIHKKAYF